MAPYDPQEAWKRWVMQPLFSQQAVLLIKFKQGSGSRTNQMSPLTLTFSEVQDF